MNILFAGNSQIACLKAANHHKPGIIGGVGKAFFYCLPGGLGPAFTIEDDKLSIISGTINKDYPPFAEPPETPERPVSSYDVIVVSALGCIGGGFSFPYETIWQGVLYDYGPKKGAANQRPISKSCCREVMKTVIAGQHGIRFLKTLRESFKGKIIVQPFPRLSSVAPSRQDWHLHDTYHDPVGAHCFLSGIRDEFLADLCSELSLELLPYPEACRRDDHFTPQEFVERPDGLHPNREYGKLVLEQILDHVTSNHPRSC